MHWPNIACDIKCTLVKHWLAEIKYALVKHCVADIKYTFAKHCLTNAAATDACDSMWLCILIDNGANGNAFGTSSSSNKIWSISRNGHWVLDNDNNCSYCTISNVLFFDIVSLSIIIVNDILPYAVWMSMWHNVLIENDIIGMYIHNHCQQMWLYEVFLCCHWLFGNDKGFDGKIEIIVFHCWKIKISVWKKKMAFFALIGGNW